MGIGAQSDTTTVEFDTTSIALSGDGLPPQGVVTGEKTSFMILFPGHGDINQLSVSIVHENGEPFPCTCEHQAGMGVVVVCFTPTIIGYYIITIQYNGVETSSSPICVLVIGTHAAEEEVTIPLTTDVELAKFQEDIEHPETVQVDIIATATPVVEEETSSTTTIDIKPDTVIVEASLNDTQVIPEKPITDPSSEVTIVTAVETETQLADATQPDIPKLEAGISTKSPEIEIKNDQHVDILAEVTHDAPQDEIPKDIEPQDAIAM